MAILSIFPLWNAIASATTADPRHIQIMIMYNLYSYLNFEIVYCLMKTCTFSPRSTSNAKICARAYPREQNAPALCSLIFFLLLLFVICSVHTNARQCTNFQSVLSLEFFTNHRIPFVPLHSILGSAETQANYVFTFLKRILSI